MIEAVLLNDTRVDRHHGCTSVVETIDRLAEANGIAIIARSPAHADWRADPAILNAIDRASLVLVNGEGTIHHDRPAGLALLAAGAHARCRGKKAALINATWQANGSEALRALGEFDLVSLRESASEAELAAHGIATRRIPDLALYHRPELAPARSGVGYCDSVNGPMALALYRKMWALDARPLPITDLPRDPTTALRWLLRHGRSKAAMLNPAHGLAALRATMQDYRCQLPDRDALTRLVAAQQLVVTGRFHMLVFCLAAGTPLLAIGSNTHKNEATLADAGLESWRALASPDLITPALIERAGQWRGEEEARLAQFVAQGRTAMEQLFTDLAKLGSG